MKKWVLFFSLFILVIFFSFVGYTYVCRAGFLSTILTKTLHTQVKVKSINFSKQGVIAKGISIQNPPGCTLKNALQVDRIEVKMSWNDTIKAFLGFGDKKITIDQIKVISPTMGIELFTLTGSDTNWKRILSALPETSSEPSSREFEIKKLTITNIQLEVKQQTLSESSFKPSPIAKIELKNIGSDKAKSAQEIFRVVFLTLMTEASKELQLRAMQPENLLKNLPPEMQEGAKQATEKLKDWLQKN